MSARDTFVGYTVEIDGAGIKTHGPCPYECPKARERALEASRDQALSRMSSWGSSNAADMARPRGFDSLPGSARILRYDHDGERATYTVVEELLVSIWRSPRVGEWSGVQVRARGV